MRVKKILTPEEERAKKDKIARQHKEWRERNPGKWQDIVDRHHAKKAGVQIVGVGKGDL